MTESERDQVISMLRACLLSIKGGIPVSNLDRDYKMIVGSKIPYQKLGYQTLEQFLKSIPNVSISQDRNGQMILDAIPSKNSEHLAALVSKQKSAPKKPTRSLPPRRTAASSWRPPPSVTSVKPMKRSSRMPLSVTVSNRFDDNRSLSFDRPSRMVSFSNSTTSTTHTNTGRSLYEKPPRFLRLEQQETTASVPFVEKTVHTAPISVPNVPTVIKKPEPPKTMSKVQDRLHQVPASLKSMNTAVAFNENIATNKSEIPGAGSRRITSPLTPLQARLNAIRKPQVFQAPVLTQLEEKFASASLGGGEDYTKLLEEFAQSKGMSKPVFKIMPRMEGKTSYYSCSVKIDDYSISCYPDERPLPGEAVQLAAKQAFDELNQFTSAVGGSTTQDENIIMTRISHIVQQHRYGIWSMQIPIDYSKKYSETLPDNWLKIMSKCPNVSLEHIAVNRIILTPNWPASPTEQTGPVLPAVNLMDTHHGKPSLSPIGPVVPDPIHLPEDDVWDVYITCGNSTDEIWFRLIGEEYSVKYENLATDMEMFYLGKTNVVVNPELDMYYAIKMDDCWHRVKVIEINEACTEARIFFIDHGDEETVDLRDLHVLERRFAKLPPQAVPCYLWGLEDFIDHPNVTQHITDHIVGKSLIASIKSRPSSENRAVGVILYDTSTDEDMDMNNVLLESISKTAMAPQLPPEGKVEEAYISHVTSAGDIFLQFDSYNYLQTLMSNMIETGLKESNVMKGINDSSSNPNQLYLARYHMDGNWYRAAIVKKLDAHKVEVIFVDFGNTEAINEADLIVLDPVKKSVAEYPHQALKVHLHNVAPSSFTDHLAERIRELVPCDERVLVKTISFGRLNSNIPVVDIFKRIQPDNLLVSISVTLAYEIDQKQTEDRGRKRLERLQSLTSTSDNPASNMLHSPTGSDLQNDATSSRGLNPPQIPEIGEYFDVHVTMAANPGNFTVQPYKDSKRLEKMMETMQEHYNERKYPQHVTENVHEGGLFAALHSDGCWYRVCVSNVIAGNMISVYFCDYGDVSVLTVDKLQPLTNQFKELPYQAIKAKLAGIQPKHSDWSVEDCLMFQELVVEHQFVSVIKETGPDLLNPSDTVIGLTLIDTSGEEDVYIDKLLVAQERAIVTQGS